jgi:hypothetical protein
LTTSWIVPLPPLVSTGFVHGGQTYFEFGLTHRGYFELMFRSDLHDGDDVGLVSARASATSIRPRP